MDTASRAIAAPIPDTSTDLPAAERLLGYVRDTITGPPTPVSKREQERRRDVYYRLLIESIRNEPNRKTS